MKNLINQKVASNIGILVLLLLVSVSEVKAKKLVTDNKYDDIALLSRVLNYIEKHYVDKVDSKRLVHGAISGMLNDLDPHSSFLGPEIYRQMKNDTSGKFGGIGIEIWLGDDGLLTVLQPIEGTPAWDAGIMSGDKIIKINGENTKGLSLIDAVAKMRGKNGETITLSIFRDGFEDLKDFAVKRTEIKIKSVKSQTIEPKYGYFKLNHFQENSARELNKHIKRYKNKNGLKGIILDLRNNPGGLLDEAVAVSNLFIDDGVIVTTQGRDKTKTDIRRARSGKADKSTPLVILVNGNTASAAEIVAGAVKDHKRGLILGSQTFGKGSVQQVIPLSDEVGIKLTVAKYYTPSGVSIQETGISPDVLLDEVDPDQFKKALKKTSYVREEDLQGHIENSKAKRKRMRQQVIKEFKIEKNDEPEKNRAIDPSEDFQVQQALQYLKGYQLIRSLDKEKS